MIETILVATDGSECALAAERCSVALFQEYPKRNHSLLAFLGAGATFACERESLVESLIHFRFQVRHVRQI